MRDRGDGGHISIAEKSQLKSLDTLTRGSGTRQIHNFGFGRVGLRISRGLSVIRWRVLPFFDVNHDAFSVARLVCLSAPFDAFEHLLALANGSLQSGKVGGLLLTRRRKEEEKSLPLCKLLLQLRGQEGSYARLRLVVRRAHR